MIASLPAAAARRVGSHLLSRVSVSRNTASCDAMREDRVVVAAAAVWGSVGWSGMGMARICEEMVRPGWMARRAAAAVGALGRPAGEAGGYG